MVGPEGGGGERGMAERGEGPGVASTIEHGGFGQCRGRGRAGPQVQIQSLGSPQLCVADETVAMVSGPRKM